LSIAVQKNLFIRVLRTASILLLGAFHPSAGFGSSPDTPVSSQEMPVTGSKMQEGIVGTVVDESGTPLAGVFVEVTPESSNAGPVPDMAILTDAQGKFEWRLGPGRYVVAVAPQGFRQNWMVVEVRAGRTTSANFIARRAGN
jgi:hypothetical protein